MTMEKEEDIIQPSAEEPAEDFAKLFEASENQKEGAAGGIFLGRVVAVDHEGCLLDIGRKSEARVPASDMPPGLRVESGFMLPVVWGGKDQDGQGRALSVRRAVRRLQWEALEVLYREGARVEGRILRVRGDGLFAGLRVQPTAEALEKFKEVPPRVWEAFIYPVEIAASEIDVGDPRPLKRWVGRPSRFKIVSMNSGGPVMVSRRKIVEETREESRKETLAKAKPGDVLSAKVLKINETSVLLGSNGVECVLSQEEASWYPKPNLARQFRPGDMVKVQVIKADIENQKFLVSRRVLMSHPADDLSKQYKSGAVVEGEISRMLPRGGYFVRIAGLKRDAYVPHKETYQDPELKEGSKIKATVMKVDRESIRLVLSHRRYEKVQDSKIMAKYTSEEQPYSLGDILNPVEGEEE